MTANSTAYLAVDLGSSSARVMLGLLTGTETMQVQQVTRIENIPQQQQHGLSWNIPELFEGVINGLKEGVALAAAMGATVRGIGVDSWGVDYGRLTAEGTLRPFVRHHRDADPQIMEHAGIDVAEHYRITGVLDQAINTAHQLRQDQRDGVGAPDDRIVPIGDLMVYLLTGTIAAEHSLASTTALMDAATKQWSPQLTDALHGTLPPLVQPGTAAGPTTAKVTAQIGAQTSIDVWFVTAHDTAAAFAAVTSATDSETVGVVSCGSWSIVGLSIEHPILTDEPRLAGFTQELGAEGHTLLAKNLSGMWLVQQSTREWGQTSPQALERLLAAAATSTYTGEFDPADPILQAPGPLSERITHLCVSAGYAPPSSHADIIRSILASLASAYAQTLGEAMALTGTSISAVRIVGGGARGDLLCELTTARTGLPVIAGPGEASVHGVLLQLAVAAGDVPDLDTARGIDLVDGDLPQRHYQPPATSNEESQ